VKQVNMLTLKGRKYATIVASIKEIGLVEPPVVYPAKGNGSAKKYILLDGHLRLEALKDLGET
jgi:ParB-like chromosome segregation protein Spo0J